MMFVNILKSILNTTKYVLECNYSSEIPITAPVDSNDKTKTFLQTNLSLNAAFSHTYVFMTFST